MSGMLTGANNGGEYVDFTADRKGNLGVQGNSSELILKDYVLEPNSSHVFDLIAIGASTTIGVNLNKKADYELRVTPRGYNGSNEINSYLEKDFNNIEYGVFSFDNESRFYRVRIKNTSSESITVRQIVATHINSKLQSKIEFNENDGSKDVEVNVHTQHITNQRLVYLSNNDPEFPKQISESRPCLIQSVILKSDEKINRYRLVINSIENDGTNQPSAHIISSPSFENINDIGGEDAHFRITKYDDEEDLYVMILKKPVYCPLGFTLLLPYDNGDFRAEISTIYFNEVD